MKADHYVFYDIAKKNIISRHSWINDTDISNRKCVVIPVMSEYAEGYIESELKDMDGMTIHDVMMVFLEANKDDIK